MHRPDDELLVDRPAPGIARITLNRPRQMNALTPELRERLRELIDEKLADSSVIALVLTGSGGHFCAGGDLAQLAALPKHEVGALLRSGHRLIRLLAESPKPVIAAVEGAAAGGGLGLAMACDTMVMSRTASLVLPFHRIGLVADYGLAWSLARRLGAARAHQWLMHPAKVAAEQALTLGLADQIADEGKAGDAALAMAIEMAAHSPLTLAWTKRLMLAQLPPLQATLDLEVDAQSQCFASPEFDSGVAAFLAHQSR